LVSDAVAETVADAVALGSFVAADFNWTMTGGGLISDTFRGRIEWEFNVPSQGDWLLHVRTGLLGTLRDSETVDVDVTLNGVFIGRHSLRYGMDRSNLLRLIAPNLAAGTHRLGLNFDNYIGRRAVLVKSIEVRQPAGPDLDGDGRIDWIAAELARTNHVAAHGSHSKTSPFCLEGNATVRDAVLVNGQPVLRGGGSRHWFLNLALDPSGAASGYSAVYDNGLRFTGAVGWEATNVLEGGEMVIRRGDSLLLGAWIPGGAGSATVAVAGQTYQVAGPAAEPHLFDQAGTFTATATHDGGTAGALVIHVRHADLPAGHRVLENSASPYRLTTAQAHRSLHFEGGEGLALGPIRDINPDQYELMLYPAWGGTYGLLARLHPGGPILDAVAIDGVGVSDALQNELTSGMPAPGHPGHMVYSTPLVVKNLPPGGSVIVDINRGGVSFMDGTKQMIFHESDFRNGLLYLQFLAPAGLGGGYCHSIRILDADGNEVR
jgi:hypothetical protein